MSSSFVVDEKRLAETEKLLVDGKELLTKLQSAIVDNGGELEFEFCGEKFVNYSDVFFLPGYDCVAENLPSCDKEGAKFLEVGCGTGCISVIHYLRNRSKIAYVLATDINRRAIENTTLNFKRHDVPGDAKFSDMFSDISGDEKFDLILWNPPLTFKPSDEAGNLSILDRAIVDPGYRASARFIKESRRYLSPGGRAVFGFVSKYGIIELLEANARETNSRLEKIWSGPASGDYDVDFELWQIIPN